jgi:mannosylglycoprotein endo-beta-mannosidase
MGIEEKAHLHTFTFSVFINDELSDQKQIAVGVRTIETFVDQKTKGQMFLINGRAVYLVGGNWIATDQALRYSASLRRYCHEIALHRYAGINLLRVWGGGTAERDQFYTCADRLGVLVYQEMWMTGDNNGRWAGDYSWPLDYGAYLSNVEDTVKRLRNHPSLLFYGGCNECLAPNESSWAPNPPSEINDGIRVILGSFDPDRFYIPSSMGGVSLSL